MVTTRKTSDSKVRAMDEGGGAVAAPPRTQLGEVNAHLVCALCHGYYIDATTIVECLHSFCRSCIITHLQAKSYCPVCEMMINSAKPNIKPDKALQDIVYKLVPGLFQREMQRRQNFYASRPGQAASATPEQRGEDTERIIFSPEDVISFSLEYMDGTEVESASSRSSESGNESMPCNETGAPTRRYLQCPAVVNISHLKKFLSMKYDIDASNFFVDILYKRVPLPDYYTLMDIAYIYNWKRNEPMRFFYQITDFKAIRDRFGFFGINGPGALLRRKPNLADAGGPGSPASPAHGSALTEASSDGSSGSYSPGPELMQANSKTHDFSSGNLKGCKDAQRDGSPPESCLIPDSQNSSQSSSSMDAEKSEFLNSFELTAKPNATSGKSSGSPVKDEVVKTEEVKPAVQKEVKTSPTKSPVKPEASPSKRKSNVGNEDPNEEKKQKLTPEKNPKEPSPVKVSKPSVVLSDVSTGVSRCPPPLTNFPKVTTAPSVQQSGNKNVQLPPNKPMMTLKSSMVSIPSPQLPKPKPVISSDAQKTSDAEAVAKKCAMISNKSLSLKRKLSEDSSVNQPSPKPVNIPKPDPPKTIPTATNTRINEPKSSRPVISDVRIPPRTNMMAPKIGAPKAAAKPEAVQKPELAKEIPKSNLQKMLPSQLQNMKQTKGDPLKSLFDSCNINIPSSLSITLTDQKLEQREVEIGDNSDPNKQGSSGSTASGSQSSSGNFQSTPVNPPVHNYIEILKLPDAEASKKPSDLEKGSSTPPLKPGESSAPSKGPVPNLKPIADAKQPKNGSFTKPQTFQQTFLQSLQQQSEKPRFIKTRIDFPSTGVPVKEDNPESTPEIPSITPVKPTNTMPTPKSVPVSQPLQKLTPIAPKPVKSDSALDLSTPHPIQSKFGPQQAKLETMKSIANLAKRQSYTQRMTSPSQAFSQDSFKMNSSNPSPLRIPVPHSHMKHSKGNTSTQSTMSNSPKHFPEYFQPLKAGNSRSDNGSPGLNNKSTANQSAPYTTPQRSHTRSPSSSPKLVIACPSPKSNSPEEKQIQSPRTVDNGSQSNLITSSQLFSVNAEATGSKDAAKKNYKPQMVNKPAGVRPDANKSGNGASAHDMLQRLPAQVLEQQAYLRHQLELQTQLGLLPQGTAAQWFNNPLARQHFENLMKNMSRNQQLPFLNHNTKDNK